MPDFSLTLGSAWDLAFASAQPKETGEGAGAASGEREPDAAKKKSGRKHKQVQRETSLLPAYWSESILILEMVLVDRPGAMEF